MNGPSRRTALITGASRGIGRVVAEKLGAEGVHCLLLARDQAALEDTAQTIRAFGGTAQILPVDLAAANVSQQLSDALRQSTDRLDALLLNAAAGGTRVSLPEYPPELWRQLFDVNVHSVQALLAATHPLLTRSSAGRVLFVSSGVARNWKVNTGAYAVTKAALQAIAGIYAKEIQDTAILSNTINPGATRTEMRAAAYPQEDPGNLKTADDIAPLFVHLLSPECSSHGADFDADEWLSTQRANS